MIQQNRAGFEPLVLVVPGEQTYRRVASLRQAAEALLIAWPSDDGEEYMDAVKTCFDAMQGKLTAVEARAAFVRAAVEAGLPIIAMVASAGEIDSRGPERRFRR
ncbi:DUF982 domain-containing protein [Rhizobium grahamii]|uniref:DUF982 domain-containing protein n=2 Tax=Rhizobium grahamii TaxID=1120045 RepID=S3HC63_9HYPH|nr:DUF982 domain-containing protein [Rhizobium grahamii]EPE96194.1 hypothetical protein RGCCGE502_21490 [Rhizobium grahamii CCGE 502]RDJ03007.1 hypothetical protein B5K06_31480 [Rhizobium grahamii]